MSSFPAPHTLLDASVRNTPCRATSRQDTHLCPDLTVVLLSDDAQQAADVGRLLAPDAPGRRLVWHRGPVDHWSPDAPGTPLCVLVGGTAGRPRDIATQVRQRAPYAAVVLLSDVPRTGSFHARIDHRGTTAEEFQEQMAQALRRALPDPAPVRGTHDGVVLERGLLPRLDLHDDCFTSAAHYAPSRVHALLGGDFCDLVQSEDGTVHVVMGDVSGHGAAEAALAVHLRLAWRTAVLCGQTHVQRLPLLERVLAGERPREEIFATVVSLVFPPHGRSVRVLSAGHPGMLHRHAGGVRWVEHRPGLALGLFPGRGGWTETELPLAERDRVVLFTDGLYEARTATGRLGEEGLLRLAARHAQLPAQHFVDALVRDAAAPAQAQGGPADDVSILHLGWERPPAP
ncbi:PP2C family protein-serine/threonine phosphatase [Streptomyces longwoodensis]|uniref:PP2C family protein-serine/threonine phosphatase n=1 Tax=Streptomyces longwoodensis TaxID=68231 RepID=UPI00340E0D0D